MPKSKASAVVEIKAKASPGAIAPHIREVVRALGEDLQRDGLAQTPERVEKALRYLTSGYSADLAQIVNGALFDVDYDEMVIVRDIEFFSMCEHHMLPFFGKMHVAYLPDKKVIGLSKIPRIVDVFARRLQIQERLTQQIAETIRDLITPKGVAVICEARHFCMMMRGVEKQHSGAITSAMLGAFRDNQETRNELLSLVGRRSTAL
ncbi:MAG TPA: GTP cyclohydrolase I FolE [Bryobacteraceae bacterium]|jgi:GTP cyclohydrolase I